MWYGRDDKTGLVLSLAAMKTITTLEQLATYVAAEESGKSERGQLGTRQSHQAFPASTLSGCSVSCWQIYRCVEGPGCDPTLGLRCRDGIDLANAALSNLFPGQISTSVVFQPR